MKIQANKTRIHLGQEEIIYIDLKLLVITPGDNRDIMRVCFNTTYSTNDILRMVEEEYLWFYYKSTMLKAFQPKDIISLSVNGEENYSKVEMKIK